MRAFILLAAFLPALVSADDKPQTYTFTFTAEQVRIIAAAVNQATATGYGRPLLNGMDAEIAKQDAERKPAPEPAKK